MADVMTPEQRSRCMSRIRGRDTKPEIFLRKEAWRRGLRYRLNYKLTGKPDLVFVAARVAVFVDGCFWHGCAEHGVRPKSNADFWKRKIDRNIQRDNEVNETLSEKGWRVLRFWEHEVFDHLDRAVDAIEQNVRSSAT